MNTTTLYAELIVVGSGTSIFLALFLYSRMGDAAWLSKLGGLSSIGSVASLIPFLSVIYLLGIVITNVAHLIFKGWEDALRNKALAGSQYEEVRTRLYTSGDNELIEEFRFRRSKIRICRGWFINSILILIALLSYLWTGKMPEAIVWFSIIIVWLLMIGIRVSWLNATNTELKWLKSYAKKIKPAAPKPRRITSR